MSMRRVLVRRAAPRDGAPTVTAVFEPIGRVETAHGDLENMPSQASESDDVARVVIDERFTDGLLGLERYQYLWLVTWLHRQPEGQPLRLVPRATAETGEVQGVFASRSPARPNPIGLSLVRCVSVAGNVLTVDGTDLVDGTPVLDVKPWFADCDTIPGAESPSPRGEERS